MKLFIFFILLLSITYGCANAPRQEITYAEFMKQYEGLEEPVPERVIFDFAAACNDEGMCYVEEKRLDAAAKIITDLNTAYQESIKSLNSRLNAFAHCEYASTIKDDIIADEQRRYDNLDLKSSIKEGALTLLTIAGAAVCLGR